MIGGDDISNDVINLCTCFFNVCLHSRSFPLHANWQKSDSSVNGEPQGIGGGIQILETSLQALPPSPPPPPPPCQSVPESVLEG